MYIFAHVATSAQFETGYSAYQPLNIKFMLSCKRLMNPLQLQGLTAFVSSLGALKIDFIVHFCFGNVRSACRQLRLMYWCIVAIGYRGVWYVSAVDRKSEHMLGWLG